MTQLEPGITRTGDTVSLSVDRARELATDVLVGIGAPRDIAAEVAEHLVEADRVGHGSHGISRLASYLAYAESGILTPSARPELVRAAPTAVVSANWGFSHVGARLAAQVACERALADKMGVAGLVQATHVGRLGAYMEQAARANCIALAFVGGMGGKKLVAPHGGRTGLLGTNPIAAGFPASSGVPFVIDFSTASAPIGKIMLAAMAGERLPQESLIDERGRPTDDPRAIDEGGSMRTFGDHKGFGLAVLVELLGRVLLGSTTLNEGQGGDIFKGQGLVVMAIAADAFRDLDDVLADAESLRQSIHEIPPADGVDSVLAPGDPEFLRRNEHSASITVGRGAWESIADTATKLGVRVESD